MIDNLDVSGLIGRHPQLAPASESVVAAVNLLIESFAAGRKLLICGNGGSAADADHIAGELNKGFLDQRPLTPSQRELFGSDDDHIAGKLQRALPSINLTSSAALISAFGNDVDWTYALAQQVWALGSEGDVLLAISTSGSSKNVVYAATTARAKGIPTVALTGHRASPLSEIADVAIMAPATPVHHVQELHLPIYHAICIELEQFFFAGGQTR